MAQTVAQTLVGVLERIGVKQIFALIGDSLNPLADAVRRSSIEWIGVRHEEGAALAASGQAKLTGRLAVCAGTTGSGSTHLVAGLYEAARDHAPVLALVWEFFCQVVFWFAAGSLFGAERPFLVPSPAIRFPER